MHRFSTALQNKRAIVLISLALTLASIDVALAEAGRDAPARMCWTTDEMAFRPGEDQILADKTRAFVRLQDQPPPRSSPLPTNERQAIRRVNLPHGKKVVALTFDLCEQPHEVSGYQGQIVDYLRRNSIEATFFVGGKWLLSHPDRGQQLMSDPLFELGNHTWEHRNLRIQRGSALVKEIERAQVAYVQVRDSLTGRQCLAADGLTLAHNLAARQLSLFRFPFGACDDRSLEAVSEMGLKAIQWDVSSGDPSIRLRAEDMVKDVLNRIRPGSIVLFHANGRGYRTPEALPLIVTDLRRQGFSFAKVSDLLRMGTPVYSPTCYDVKKGDTNKYDRLSAQLEYFYDRERKKAMSTTPEHEGVPAPLPARRPARGLGSEVGVPKKDSN